MFENILHQDRVIGSLKDDLGNNNLPQALLFTGPTWAGKASAALELARVLSCSTPGAPWNCTCNGCTMQRSLQSPYLLLLGKRYFVQEIRGAGLALLQDDRDAVRYLFTRTVRKLTRRFDPVLWEGDSKFSKVVKVLEKLEELMIPLAPGKTKADLVEPTAVSKSGAVSKSKATVVNPPQSMESWLARVYELVGELVDFLPQDGVNAAMIRHATYWAHTADSSMAKVIIIEGPEYFNESTRNSLLKTLEEPPPGVWFILLSQHRQAIMQTILSRVRTYTFQDRGSREAEVITRVFRHDGQKFSSLHGFFASADPESQKLIVSMSRSLWAAMNRYPGAPGFEQVLALAAKAKDYSKDVVRSMLALARDELNAVGDVEDLQRLHGLIRLVSEEGHNALVFNRSLPSLAETLYTAARMRV